MSKYLGPPPHTWVLQFLMVSVCFAGTMQQFSQSFWKAGSRLKCASWNPKWLGTARRCQPLSIQWKVCAPVICQPLLLGHVKGNKTPCSLHLGGREEGRQLPRNKPNSQEKICSKTGSFLCWQQRPAHFQPLRVAFQRQVLGLATLPCNPAGHLNPLVH